MSALMLSLVSSTFNIKENLFKSKSLNSQYFKEQHLVNFKDETTLPHERLNEISAKTRNAPMITKAFNVKGMVPKPVTKGNESKVHEFIEKIIKYSELISNNKKTSADNSISSLLSKVFRKSPQHSKPEDCNHKPGHPSNDNYATVGAVIGPNSLERSARVNWSWDHIFQTIVQIKKPVHKAIMEKFQNDDYKAYGWCGLLATDKWDTYIKESLNENARSAFIAKMTNKEEFPKNASPPYGIFYESMTVTVGKIEKGRRWVDQRHLNEFNTIPIIVKIVLHAKKKNDIIPNVVSDDLNHRMINYICRYIYATKLHNQNTLHPAVEMYLPEVTGEYLNMCMGKYQVIPVSVFLMTLYNACFMFQQDKTDNMLIKALERFNLTPNLDGETFFTTLSK
jgi:hypothetical protein